VEEALEMKSGSEGPARPAGEIRFSLPDIGDAEVEAAARALRSGWITTGEESKALEAELAEYLGVPHVVAVASATAAIEIAVARLGLPRGSRIGVPTWTFVSTALAPYHRGLVPVLLDVDPETLNLSVDALDGALEEGLDAVVAVHFAGTPLPAAIRDRCRQANVPLIEDAAHALGARDDRGLIAGQGTAGCCFSFYATKNLTCAEGGALTTDDPELAAFAESFRLHGMSRDAWARYLPGAKTAGYDLIGDGLKANLPDVLAAVARVQLSRFPALQSRRVEIAEQYRALLKGIDGLEVVPPRVHEGSANHLMMVLLPPGSDRDAVQRAMANAQIGTSVHFRPLHRFRWFEEHARIGPGGTPVADAAELRALSLPMHTMLTSQQVERVCDVFRAAVR
jgi:dTDP-4-amino-4,6-dideoxygalactose transaminase